MKKLLFTLLLLVSNIVAFAGEYRFYNVAFHNDGYNNGERVLYFKFDSDVKGYRGMKIPVRLCMIDMYNNSPIFATVENSIDYDNSKCRSTVSMKYSELEAYIQKHMGNSSKYYGCLALCAQIYGKNNWTTAVSSSCFTAERSQGGLRISWGANSNDRWLMIDKFIGIFPSGEREGILQNNLNQALADDDFVLVMQLMKVLGETTSGRNIINQGRYGQCLYQNGMEALGRGAYYNARGYFVAGQKYNAHCSAGMGYLVYNGLGINRDANEALAYYLDASMRLENTGDAGMYLGSVERIALELGYPKEVIYKNYGGNSNAVRNLPPVTAYQSKSSASLAAAVTTAGFMGAVLGIAAAAFSGKDHKSSSNKSSSSGSVSKTPQKTPSIKSMNGVEIMGFNSSRSLHINPIKFSARNTSGYEKVIKVQFWYSDKWEDTHTFRVPAGRIVDFETFGRDFHKAEDITLVDVF